MHLKKIALIGIVVIWGAYSWYSQKPITYEGRGQMVREQPLQQAASRQPFLFKDKYTIVPLADFAIRARVLSSKRYRFDDESDLAPVDLLQGWGVMSDDAVLSKLELSQSGRWSHWRCKVLPVPREQIEQNAANMHLIPANEDIDKSIKSVKTGNVIKLRGYLVKVTRSDGWKWQSSLSRNDTGNGSCEVIFVTDFDTLI
jgi:hypothetical protein